MGSDTDMPSEQDKSKRPRFQIRLRELLLIVALVASGLAWWIDHWRCVEKMDVLSDRISYWSGIVSIIEAGLADGGFTLERKVIGDREGRWGVEIYLTSPDGKTYGGGAIVVPP